MQSTLHSATKTSNQVATVVFIDAGVENYQQLVNGVIPAAEVFVLDAAADGIEQISKVLQQHQDIGAVHIVSHGAPGSLYLGNTQLSLDTFNRYATQLQQWDVANLSLYGCHVAAGDAGEEFIAKLHRLTGANIAASRTPTGNSALGGNWELEVVLGQQQPLLAFQPSIMAAYKGILANPILNVSGTTNYNGSQVEVDPTLTITDRVVRDTLNGATVVINGQVTGEETLGIAGQTNGSISGISWNYDDSSGVMRLTGTANVSTYQSLLRQVTYQNTSATPTTPARDIEFTLGTAIYNPENEHFYDYVQGSMTWTAARDAAASSKDEGLQGYLATITSDQENSLIASKLGGKGWIGASDAAVEGDWRWVTGPEAGTQFWQGDSTGTAVNGQYSNWATTYGGTNSPEPNNLDGNENYGHMHPLSNDPNYAGESGKWNDFRDDQPAIEGYVVEYGGMPGDPSVQITGARTITFDQPPTDQNPGSGGSDQNPGSDGSGQNPASTAIGRWDFLTTDYNHDGATDIIDIMKSGTGQGKTEVHIMDAATNYNSWLLHTATVLGETDDNFDFVKGDYNRDGATDIMAIMKSGTGQGKTEVHIMNGADNYQSWLLETPTALPETGNNFDFQAADFNGDGVTDIIAIKKSDTGTKSTEIHILDGASNYQNYLLQTGTPLEETGDNFAFQVGDFNHDGRPDILAIKKSDTPNGMTEVHILNGADNYQSWLLKTPTALHQTGNDWAFLMDDYNRNNSTGMIGLKEGDTNTGTTEAHILNGGTYYDNFSLQTGTILPQIVNSSLV